MRTLKDRGTSCYSINKKWLAVSLFFLLLFPAFLHASDYHRDAVKYFLPNGLTVILEQDNSSAMVCIQLWIKSGSVQEGKFCGAGIAHLLEHMVYEGSEKRNAKQISKQVELLGGELNGSTSPEYSIFGITIPSGNIKNAMVLVKDVLTEAEMIEKEFVKEKDVIRREMDMVDDDHYKYLSQIFIKTAYQGHPFAMPVIGTRPMFDMITRDDLIQYYHSRYFPQNMILVVTGNFNQEELRPFIEKLWGGMNPGFEMLPDIPREVEVIGPIRQNIYRKINKPYLMMGFYGPSAYSNDVYAMEVLSEIMGKGKDSRLIKKMRDELGLVSEIDAWVYMPKFTGIFGISAELLSSNVGNTAKNILKEIYKLKFVKVTQKELARAKKCITRRYISSLETVSGRASDLGSNELYAGNPLFTNTYINGIKAVRAGDIERAAKKYFIPRSLVICALEPESQKTAGKEQREKNKVHIEKLSLDNGMRVLLSEDKRLPLVVFRLVFSGGLLEEKKPGLSYMFSKLWLLVNHDFVKKIEDCGGVIDTYSGNNSFGCSVMVLKDDSGTALGVLKDTASSFSPDEQKIELARKIQYNQIKQQDEWPDSYGFKFVKELFFGRLHPYRNPDIGTIESVNGISHEDLIGFKNKYVVPENMVLAVFGDFDKNKIIQEIKDIFGDIKGSYKTEKYSYQIPKAVKIKKEDKDFSQTIIMLAYPGVSIYEKDRFALDIIEQIFSSQAGRLFSSIREEKGMSYSQGAINYAGLIQGAFIFYIATEASKADDAIKVLKKEITGLKQHCITQDEIDRTKTYILAKTEEKLEKKNELSLECALNELYGLGYGYYMEYADGIKSVTPEDIKRTAEKYFTDEWYTLAIVGGEGEGA